MKLRFTHVQARSAPVHHWHGRAANPPAGLQAGPGVWDADALIALGRSLRYKRKHRTETAIMGDVVDLHPAPFKDDHEFVVDLARFAEGITTEEAIRKKYRLAEDVWTKLGDDDELVRAITDEKTRRIRNGATKREKAQKLVLAAPDVAAKIMLDDGANARHRLDACKVLDDFSATGPAAAAAQDRFTITINLGSDMDGKPVIETYDKSIAIDANDGTAPNPASGGVSPRIIADKRWDDYGG